MLLSIKNLLRYKIEATDGGIGHVDSFLFDDQEWTIRYLVIDTGNWLPGRKVLVPPSALGKPGGMIDAFPVEFSREQVKNSPDINTEKPVSRQQEIELYAYYNWSPYWGIGGGPIATPHAPIVPPMSNESGENQSGATGKPEEDQDPHLRSTKEVMGYHIHAKDDQIGHVEDFLVDDANWKIRYIIVDTRNWWPGKKVLVSPDWIKDISWADSEVAVDVVREKVKNSPEFDPAISLNRDYETRLYDYYGWPKYWV